jgi:hypothetical protein
MRLPLPRLARVRRDGLDGTARGKLGLDLRLKFRKTSTSKSNFRYVGFLLSPRSFERAPCRNTNGLDALVRYWNSSSDIILRVGIQVLRTPLLPPISCRLKQTWVVGGMSWGLNLFQRTLNHSLSYRRRQFFWSSGVSAELMTYDLRCCW